MQNLPTILAILLLLINFSCPAIAETCKWTIDPRYSHADFAIRHMVVSTLQGKFKRVTGLVDFDGKTLNNAQVTASIDTASVDTGVPARDDHLRNQDFFDAAKYPSMIFQSKQIEASANGKFKMLGTLTLKGISKDVILLGDLQNQATANHPLIVKATTTINRKDFGITYNAMLDNGGAMIGDDVQITISVGLTKAVPPLAMARDSTVKNN